MQLIYIGPHLEVEVPHPGGYTVAERNGKPVEFPDDVAEGLLAQGHEHAEEGALRPVDPQWKKADKPASAAPTTKGGDV